MPEMRGTIQAETPSAILEVPEGVPYTSGNDSPGVPRSLSRRMRTFCGDVLLLGHDVTLQRTRASLLEQVGFRCHLARGIDEILCMAQPHFDLVVFCHTLPLVEACKAVEDIRAPAT